MWTQSVDMFGQTLFCELGLAEPCPALPLPCPAPTFSKACYSTSLCFARLNWNMRCDIPQMVDVCLLALKKSNLIFWESLKNPALKRLLENSSAAGGEFLLDEIETGGCQLVRVGTRVACQSFSFSCQVRGWGCSSETETTFTGNLWLPVGDSNNASRRKLRRQKTRVA